MGTVKIPNRPTGGEKPKISKVLANFDAITDFLNQVPNASNVGTFDQNNWLDSINDRLGLNSSTKNQRRKLLTETVTNVYQPGISLSKNCCQMTIDIPVDGLVHIFCWGVYTLSSGFGLIAVLDGGPDLSISCGGRGDVVGPITNEPFYMGGNNSNPGVYTPSPAEGRPVTATMIPGFQDPTQLIPQPPPGPHDFHAMVTATANPNSFTVNLIVITETFS